MKVMGRQGKTEDKERRDKKRKERG